MRSGLLAFLVLWACAPAPTLSSDASAEAAQEAYDLTFRHCSEGLGRSRPDSEQLQKCFDAYVVALCTAHAKMAYVQAYVPELKSQIRRYQEAEKQADREYSTCIASTRYL